MIDELYKINVKTGLNQALGLCESESAHMINSGQNLLPTQWPWVLRRYNWKNS